MSGKPSETLRRGRPVLHPLVPVTALGLLIAGTGLGWGLPSLHGWAMDEIAPNLVRRGMEQGFSDGWTHRYPPLHFYLLTLLYLPLSFATTLGLREWEIYDIAFRLGRSLSVIMGLGTAIAIYHLTRRNLDRNVASLAAGFAALCVVLQPCWAYYSKLVNLDMPYVFWFAISLLFLARALERHRTRDYLGLAVTATFAVCTKDQAYGLYTLVPVALVWSRARHEPGGRWWRRVLNRQMGLAAVVALLLFAAIHNLAFNASGFRLHVDTIVGPASAPFREYDFTPAGLASFLRLTEAHTRFAMGLPLYLAALVGLGIAVKRRPQHRVLLITCLVPALSYALSFLLVVRYQFDRFLLPVAISLAPFAGLALAEAWKRAPVGRVAVVVLLALSLRLPVTVDLAMTRDSRYPVEAWLEHEVAAGDRVALIGSAKFLPRVIGEPHRIWLTPRDASVRLPTLGARWVVVNAEMLRISDPELLARLESGWLGFREHRRSETGLDCAPFCAPDLLRPTGGHVRTNLTKLDPQIVIYGR